MKGVTLERWFPAVALETLSGTREHVQNAGVSRALSDLRPSAKEEAEASIKQFDGAAAPPDFKWHGSPLASFFSSVGAAAPSPAANLVYCQESPPSINERAQPKLSSVCLLLQRPSSLAVSDHTRDGLK